MNPNHPHYSGLGGGPNLNLLDNMLMAAGFQATDQPIVARPTLVPTQYTYAQDVTMHQHALNLGQPHTTIAGGDPVHVIVYQQNEHQQQPISYKIPQLGTVVSQEHNFVVNDPGGQISRLTSSQSNIRVSEPSIQAPSSQSIARHVQSPAERRKDIVAQAMQEQKIFEESIPKQEPVVKQEPGVIGTDPSMSMATDTKPVITATKSSATTTSSSQRRPYQRSSTYNRQQVMPRLSILDDEDDGLTCRLCLASYWYKAEIHEHLRTVHSISDPDKYDAEEKDKKMRRMREEQQRIMLAKKQREERERRLREAKYGRGGRGGPGTIKLTSPGARPSQTPGQRPSFQYRDGAFICDLCKESFSDGNDMVTHWKSHVKKQQADAAAKSSRGRPRGRPPGGRGRGRPSLDDRRRDDSSEDDEDDDEEDDEVGVSKKKGGKGMPRWTAYLLWSTRKRRDVVIDHPDWTFAQIAKWISDEWKKIDADEKDELQKEAEEMNELGIRKLPRDDDGLDPEKDTTDDDSDFEEGYRKKTKPIMLKIKKEKGGDYDENSSDESDWEPEAEVMPPEREQTRSGRQRKRPSFFQNPILQEFESQENNLDSILEQFEKEQAQEFGKPRQPKPEKPPGEKKPRKPRKRKEPPIPTNLLEEDVEVEVLRSGRKRKVRRLMTHFMEGSDEDDKLGRGASSDDDDFEPPPEDEVQKIEENDDQIEEDDEELASEDLEDEEDDDDDGRIRYHYDLELPPKKRGRPKKLLTDEEIEEATKVAIGTKPTRPVIEIVPVPRIPKENGQPKEGGVDTIVSAVVLHAEKLDGAAPPAELQEHMVGDSTGDTELLDSKNTARKSAKSSVQENEGFKVKPPWVKETLSDSDGEGEPRNIVKDFPQLGSDGLGGGNQVVSDAIVVDLNGQVTNIVESVSVSEQQAPQDPHLVPVLTTSVFVEEGGLGGASIEYPSNPLMSESSGLAAVNEEASEGLQSALDSVSVETSAQDVNPVPLTTGETHDGAPAPLEELEPASDPNPTLSEEDLLTGPAHNLDDSQFKPDIVDPNLDDIFK